MPNRRHVRPFNLRSQGLFNGRIVARPLEALRRRATELSGRALVDIRCRDLVLDAPVVVSARAPAIGRDGSRLGLSGRERTGRTGEIVKQQAVVPDRAPCARPLHRQHGTLQQASPRIGDLGADWPHRAHAVIGLRCARFWTGLERQAQQVGRVRIIGFVAVEVDPIRNTDQSHSHTLVTGTAVVCRTTRLRSIGSSARHRP